MKVQGKTYSRAFAFNPEVFGLAEKKIVKI